jgi:hypothetical protein
MPIKIPKYEPIPRTPIPTTTPVYERFGERIASRFKYERTISDIRLEEAGARKRQGIARGIFDIAQAGLELAIHFGKQQEEVKKAQDQAQLESEAMETVKEFVELKTGLDQTTVPEDQLPGALEGLSEIEQLPQISQYAQYYTDRSDELYADILDRRKKKFSDASVGAKFEQWLSGYYSKAYAEFRAGGLDRDAKVAEARFARALRLAAEQHNPQMAEQIIRSAVSARVWNEAEGEKLLAAVVPAIRLDAAMERARRLGEAGPDFLMSEQSQKLYEITAEQAAKGAEELAEEVKDRKAYAFAANQQKIEEDRKRAEQMIESGELNPSNIFDLNDRSKFFLDDVSRKYVKDLYDDKVETQIEVATEVKKEGFDYITQLVKLGKKQEAQAELEALKAKPELAWSMQDHYDVRKAQLLIDEAKAPGDATDWDAAVVELEGKFLGPLPAAQWSDVRRFEKFVKDGDFGEDGQKKLSYFREQMEQLESRREKAAKDNRLTSLAKQPTGEEYWKHVQGVLEGNRESHDVEQLQELKNYILNNAGVDAVLEIQRIKHADVKDYMAKIDRRIVELRSDAYKKKMASIENGRTTISTFYGNKLQEIEDRLKVETRRRVVEDLIREQAQLLQQQSRALEEYDAAAPMADDTTQTALQILYPAQRNMVRDTLSRQRRLETDYEYYERLGTPELMPRPSFEPGAELPAFGAGPETAPAERVRRTSEALYEETGRAKVALDRAESDLIASMNNYFLEPDGRRVKVWELYNNMPAKEGMAWVFNKLTKQVELLPIDELTRFAQAMRKRQ